MNIIDRRLLFFQQDEIDHMIYKVLNQVNQKGFVNKDTTGFTENELVALMILLCESDYVEVIKVPINNGKVIEIKDRYKLTKYGLEMLEEYSH